MEDHCERSLDPAAESLGPPQFFPASGQLEGTPRVRPSAPYLFCLQGKLGSHWGSHSPPNTAVSLCFLELSSLIYKIRVTEPASCH